MSGGVPYRPPCSGSRSRAGTWKFQPGPHCSWAVIRRNPSWPPLSLTLRTCPGGMPQSASTTAGAPASGMRTRPPAPTSTATGCCPVSRSASPTVTSSGWAQTFPPKSCCRASTPTRRRSAASSASGGRWTARRYLAVTLPGEHPAHPEREPGRSPPVIHLELSWQQAAGAAAGLAIATVALRAARQPRLASAAVFTQETALVIGLFALWQYAGSFSVMGPGGALSRARWIWHFERAVHLPSETAIQRFFLPHPLLIQFFNLYYDVLHFPVLIATLIWLFVWHRGRYGPWRTTLGVFTGISLLVQFIPVAPPRMLPGTGLVDTAVL